MTIQNFNSLTRNKMARLPLLTRPTGGGTVQAQLPKSGFLASLHLIIRGSVAGALSAPNAQGFASIVRRVRLTTNAGIDIVNISGPGYFQLLQNLLETGAFVPTTQNQGGTVVTATTFNLDMYIPLMINRKDPIGLVHLQNEQTVVTLSVEFEADATVATGATVTATVDPYIEFFTVPGSVEAYPPLNVLHIIQEENQVVSGAGDVQYSPPRGNIYLALAHGMGMAASGADTWSRAFLRLNQTDNIYADDVPNHQDFLFRLLHGRARPLGTIFFDFMGNSGFGSYGLTRDVIDSSLVTDFQSVITATGATTLYTMRRQLLRL